MTLNELLGDAFKDGMTLDEINAALADRDLLDRSEAETMATNRAAATKRLLDAANKKLADANKKNSDAGAQNADLLERIAALEEDRKTQTRLGNIATHKASLIADGYASDLAETAATALVDGDIAAFMVAQSKFNAAQKQAWKEEQMRGTKLPAAGGNSGGAIDFAKAKTDALNAGNDAEYFRLCQLEMDQSAKK